MKITDIKNHVTSEVEEAVYKIAIDQSAYGQFLVSNELKKQGIFVSPDGIKSIWVRYDLETFKKRLKSLEAKTDYENIILTEAQFQVFVRQKERKGAEGKIESKHPGYFVFQDTFYEGKIKGVRRVCQANFI